LTILRRGNAQLAAALEWQQVVTHPFVVGELSCGEFNNRAQVLTLLHELPVAPVATDVEALALIESRSLMGRGLAYIDVHLLAAALLSPELKLWTLDGALSATAARLGVGLALTVWQRVRPDSKFAVPTWRPRPRPAHRTSATNSKPH
jgi:predicted nucleic acid-binding protein